MGGGSWTGTAYSRRTTAKTERSGTVFEYDKAMRSTPSHKRKAHESMDPKRVNKKGAHEGEITREALDNDDSPNSLPIAVFFDVTGSMGGIPKVLQEKLPTLHGLLQRKGYVENPQILFGGIGDAYSDRVPTQIGQFEADNRSGEQLEELYLEGGGGGGNHESYELVAWFMANHTYTDAWEKRGKKGFLFFVGDERIYRQVRRSHVEGIFGVTLQDDVDTAEVFEQLKERWHVFFLSAKDSPMYNPEQNIHGPEDTTAINWHGLLNQNCLVLDDSAAVCETIALTVALLEGTMDLDEGLDDLRAAGVDPSALGAAGKALATVGAATSAVASADGSFESEVVAGSEAI